MGKTVFLFLFLATAAFADPVIWDNDDASSTLMSSSDSTTMSDATASTFSQSAETSAGSSPKDSSDTTVSPGTGSTNSVSSSSSGSESTDGTPPTAGTSVAPGVVSTGGTTAPSTIPTLPPVNASYVEFSPAKCSNGFCSYSYVAPFNDPAVLATDSSIIATDNTYYNTYNQNVSDYSATVSGTILDAQKKVNETRAKLEEAQRLLNTMQAQLTQTINATSEAAANLNYANYYIKNNIDSTSGYYYCTLPPTSPPTTPTPTPPPTTTPDPCSVFDCTLGNNTCIQMPAMSGSMKPFCLDCEGNMDGFQHCEYSACGVNLDSTSGRFWSPGYMGNETGSLQSFSGQTCTWNYPVAYTFNTTAEFDLTWLGQTDDQPRMTLIPIVGEQDSGTYPISSLTNLKKVNGFLNNNNITSFQLELIIPDGYQVENSFFFWEFSDMKPKPPTATI